MAAAKSLEEPAGIPVQIRNRGVVIRMFLVGEFGGPLSWRVKRLVGRVIGLVQEPGASSICLDKANTFVGLEVRTVCGFVRLTNPVTQKRVECFEGVEESRVPWY